MDDNELMARLKTGDLDALGELIARHRTWAETMAEAMLHDHALAEDVAQEAFARVYLLRQQYQNTFRFRTYLGILVKRLCIDQIRRMKHAPIPLDAMLTAEEQSAESECLEKEKRLRLWSLLSELSETDRSLLIGYALEEKSCRLLAQEQGMTVAQVKTRLHRIRKRLKAREREGE